jgi:hypothetical protein
MARFGIIGQSSATELEYQLLLAREPGEISVDTGTPRDDAVSQRNVESTASPPSDIGARNRF